MDLSKLSISEHETALHLPSCNYDTTRATEINVASRIDKLVSNIDRVLPLVQYKLSKRTLDSLRRRFLEEMETGLTDVNLGSAGLQPKSSLKMQPTHVYNIPSGSERGVYYTLDWGGTNYRVLKTRLYGRENGCKSLQKCEKISNKLMNSKHANVLFDHIANRLKEFMIEENDYKQANSKEFPVGFCFSFPIHQPQLDSGILLEWTKGFTVPDVAGHDVTSLLHSALDRHGLSQVHVKSIVNDTVGTLLACAYDHDHTRIGVILGTGSNCAYIEPSRGNEVINVEWGHFGSNPNIPNVANVPNIATTNTSSTSNTSQTSNANNANKANKSCLGCVDDLALLPRTRVDVCLDASTPNPGACLTEKMMSGMYSGELVRLAAVQLFGSKITRYGNDSVLNQPWQWQAKLTGTLLNLAERYKMCAKETSPHTPDSPETPETTENNAKTGFNALEAAAGTTLENGQNVHKMSFDEYQRRVRLFLKDTAGLNEFDWSECELFVELCYVIVHRGADLCAAMMAAVLQKTGLFGEEQTGFKLSEPYLRDVARMVTVGIDGSVYNKDRVFRQRVKNTLNRILGEEIYARVRLVRTEDGSGKGAALAAAGAQIADASLHQMGAILAPGAKTTAT